MKKHLLLTLLAFLYLHVHAYEERNLLQQAARSVNLEEVLVDNKKWVCYPQYTDRAGWEQLLGNSRDYYMTEGTKCLDYEWKIVKATDYLEYTRNGNRSNMEGLHNQNIQAISTLFIAEMAEGKGRFIDQLANGVFHMCEMTTWSISAHLSSQRSKDSFPNYKEHAIELVSGDVGSMFSWIYYFLNKEFDKVHPLISQRLYKEINDRILTPYLTENHYWWLATNVDANKGFVNNWNPWCNSNVLQCFLLIEKDPKRLAQGVYKTMISVDKFINYNKNDGACEEGPSYWGHAAGKMYDYLQLLYDATEGKITVFSEPIIKNMGEYISRSYVGDGWVVNFADASAKGDFDYRLIYRYGNMVKSEELMQFAAYLHKGYPRKIKFSRDIYRTLADFSSDADIARAEPVHVSPSFTWYPETEFCYINEGGLFLAAKGGYNDESHNHNDTGTFSLYVDNEPAFIDVGVGTYTRKTFSSERYSIWTMQSDYHNLPRINGYSQSYGKRYKAIKTNGDGAKKSFSSDISKAYPSEAGVSRWLRSYKLEKEGLTITDKFEINRAETANQLNFMTWGNVDISHEGVVIIALKNNTIRLMYNKNEFTPSVEKIIQDDSRLSKVWGNELYRISLDSKKVVDKGEYKITINKI